MPLIRLKAIGLFSRACEDDAGGLPLRYPIAYGRSDHNAGWGSMNILAFLFHTPR